MMIKLGAVLSALIYLPSVNAVETNYAPTNSVISYCVKAGCDYSIFHTYYQKNYQRFCSNRNVIMASPRKSEIFRYVLTEVRQSGLNISTVAIPILESSLDPKAVAELHKNTAKGLWQFKPATARDMGLEVQSYNDERLDIVKSTEAGIRYIAWLQGEFDGDHNLAILAYHLGIGRLKKHMKKFGTNNPWFLSQLISEKNPDKNYLLKYYAHTLSLMGEKCS
jgi:membrane-bound lytic murein transglycosylase MltF